MKINVITTNVLPEVWAFSQSYRNIVELEFENSIRNGKDAPHGKFETESFYSGNGWNNWFRIWDLMYDFLKIDEIKHCQDYTEPAYLDAGDFSEIGWDYGTSVALVLDGETNIYEITSNLEMFFKGTLAGSAIKQAGYKIFIKHEDHYETEDLQTVVGDDEPRPIIDLGQAIIVHIWKDTRPESSGWTEIKLD